MVKAKKAKWRIEENTREGFTRYSIRKYSMGVASVAVLSGFFFLSGASVQASEIVAPQLPKQETVSNVSSLASRNQTNTDAIVTNNNLSDDISRGINEVNEGSIHSSTSKESEEVIKDNLKEENSNVHRSERRTRSVGDNPDERNASETSSQPASSSQPATPNQPDSSNKYLGTEITAYFDNNGNGKYDPGIDELIDKTVVPPAKNGAAGKDGRNGAELLSGIIAPTPEDGKDGDTYIDAATGDVYKKSNGTWNKIGNLRGPQGEKGQKGDKGENGKDGRAPKIKVDDIAKSAESAGVSSRSGIRITVYDDKNNNDELDEGDTVLNTKDVYNGTDGRNGVDGQTPKVKAVRDETKKQTTLTFYIDKDGDGNYTEGTDTLVQTSIVKDGQDGAAGRDGKSLITVKEGKETKVYQEDPTHPGQPLNSDRPLAVIRDGIDGKTPTVTAARKEEVDHKGVEITVDNHDGSQPTTVFVHDGAKGETGMNGQNGQTPTVTTQRGAMDIVQL